MNEEIWKDIEGYEGLYQVSNWGRVKSLNYKRTGKEEILSPRKHTNGYQFVVLTKEAKQRNRYVHRLVLMTFNPVENMSELQVNHINECKTDNRIENLEWVTHKENQNHGTRTLRAAEKKSIPIVQLTLDGKLVKVWKSSRDAEREGGFYTSGINACCKNKFIREGNNIYKGYRWQYLHDYISQINPRIKKVILFDKEYAY